MNGCTSVMYEGAPDYPHKGIWWELCERYGVTIFYTAPTAIRACMKWGAEHVAAHDLSKLRLLGTVGEPINPKAWLWYREVVGGGTLPDRRHLVADRDRRDHDHDASRGAVRQAGVGGDAASRGRRGGLRRGRRGRARRSAGPARAATAVAGDAAHAVPRRRSLRGDVLLEVAGVSGHLPGRRRGEARRRRLLLGHRPRRRRHQRLRPPHEHGGDRVGDRLAPQGRRGGGDRAARRGHRPGDRRLRDARGRPRGLGRA